MNEPDIKRWTAKRKAALVKELIRGQTMIAEAARQHDLLPSEIEKWVEDAEAAMVNALRANPREVTELYEKKIEELQAAYGGAQSPKKIEPSSRPGRGLMHQVQAEMAQAGDRVSVSQLCRWFGVPRRIFYYRQVKHRPKVNEVLAGRIKQFIEQHSYAGYRTIAHNLGLNRNTVQRINQLKGWQVRQRSIGFRPRARSMPSEAASPNERWSTDMTRVWCGPNDRWSALSAVMDCHTREILG